MADSWSPPTNSLIPLQRSPRQWQAYAESAMNRGVSREQWIADMHAQGCMDDSIAAIFVAVRDTQTRASNRILGCGILMIVCGTVATLIGYLVRSTVWRRHLLYILGCILIRYCDLPDFFFLFFHLFLLLTKFMHSNADCLPAAMQ